MALAVLVTMDTVFLLSFSFTSVAAGMVGDSATPAAVQAEKDHLGLGRPVLTQYLDWLSHAVRGDLGTSYFTSQPVRAAIGSSLGVTLSVVVTALLCTVLISLVLGVLAASRGGVVDRIAQGLSLLGYVAPSLLVAIVLVVVLALHLHLLRATGFTPITQDPGQWAASVTIPVIALSMGGIANLTSQIRGAMIDELRKDYVRTLRTRGIPTRSIVLRHALRNAAGPALTVLSMEFLTMFGGALIIEKVFALPGFGSYAFQASLQGDIPVVMGITLLSVLLVTGINLAVDLANGWLNPKARVH
jgi:peptide/nickel transport system permease protein